MFGLDGGPSQITCWVSLNIREYVFYSCTEERKRDITVSSSWQAEHWAPFTSTYQGKQFKHTLHGPGKEAPPCIAHFHSMGLGCLLGHRSQWPNTAYVCHVSYYHYYSPFQSTPLQAFLSLYTYMFWHFPCPNLVRPHPSFPSYPPRSSLSPAQLLKQSVSQCNVIVK